MSLELRGLSQLTCEMALVELLFSLHSHVSMYFPLSFSLYLGPLLENNHDSPPLHFIVMVVLHSCDRVCVQPHLSSSYTFLSHSSTFYPKLKGIYCAGVGHFSLYSDVLTLPLFSSTIDGHWLQYLVAFVHLIYPLLFARL